MYVAPLVTLSELKSRMKISDTNDNSVLTYILEGVSDLIESIAGRPLRRQHCRRERFLGGRQRLRVLARPVAAVHWIRESETGDFDDADAYTELEMGVDWDYDADQARGYLPGYHGWIRRLGGNFTPAIGAGPTVEICYTGGYKTDGEVALENSSLTIDGSTNTSLCEAFSVGNRYMSSTSEGYLARFLAATICNAGVTVSGSVGISDRAIVTFKPGNVLIPTWEITEATLTLYMNRVSGSSGTSIDGYLLPVSESWNSPRNMLSDLETLWTEIGELSTGQILANATRSNTTMSAQAIAIHNDAAYRCGENMSILNKMLREGFLAFAFRSDTDTTIGTDLVGGIATPRHATAGERPALVLVHRDTLGDELVMPEDLKHACAMQAAHEFQTRQIPGFTSETQRGVSISSGISYMKPVSAVLPLVDRIARQYSFS